MEKSQKVTNATITKTKSKAPTKKQGHIYKRKPEDDPIDSKAFSSPEPTHMPHQKRAKRSANNEDEIETLDDEPETTISLVSSSGRDDTASSNEEVRHQGYSVTQRLTHVSG